MRLTTRRMSGSLITRVDFLKFVHPQMRGIVKRIDKEGDISLVHICGNTTDRLEDIATLGMSAFSADSSVYLRYARKVFGRNVALIGNVNPYQTSLNGSMEKIEQAAEKCLREGGREGYILGALCDLLSSIPMENIQVLDRYRRV